VRNPGILVAVFAVLCSEFSAGVSFSRSNVSPVRGLDHPKQRRKRLLLCCFVLFRERPHTATPAQPD